MRPSAPSLYSSNKGKREEPLVLHKLAAAILARQVKRETAKSGAIGLLAGVAATAVLRRSVPGALVIGGVVVARQLIKMKNMADARRAAEAEAGAADKVAEEKTTI